MSNLAIKDKLKDSEIESFENLDGRLVMLETLKNKGLDMFPETRVIPFADLMNTAVIYYGWKFSDTVKRYANYYLMRFYRRNGYEIQGASNKEQIRIPLGVFDEIQKYEAEWKDRIAKQISSK